MVVSVSAFHLRGVAVGIVASAALTLWALPSISSAQSLAAVAAKEKERRQANERKGVEADVYSMFGVPGPPPKDSETAEKTRPESSSTAEKKETKPPESPEPTVKPPRLPPDGVIRQGPSAGLASQRFAFGSAPCVDAQVKRLRLEQQLNSTDRRLATCTQGPRSSTASTLRRAPGGRDRIEDALNEQRQRKCGALRMSRELLVAALAELNASCRAQGS